MHSKKVNPSAISLQIADKKHFLDCALIAQRSICCAPPASFHQVAMASAVSVTRAPCLRGAVPARARRCRPRAIAEVPQPSQARQAMPPDRTAQSAKAVVGTMVRASGDAPPGGKGGDSRARPLGRERSGALPSRKGYFCGVPVRRVAASCVPRAMPPPDTAAVVDQLPPDSALMVAPTWSRTVALSFAAPWLPSTCSATA